MFKKLFCRHNWETTRHAWSLDRVGEVEVCSKCGAKHFNWIKIPSTVETFFF